MKDPIGSLILDRSEAQKMREREQIRRRGHKFIKVINTGRLNRIHSVDDVQVFETQNPDTGETEHTTRIDSATLTFSYEDVTGDMVAHVLDTERNRFFLARHLDLGLQIDDEKMREEIEKLVNEPYVVELSEIEMLKRKRLELQREIRNLESAESEAQLEESTKTKKKRPPYQARLSGDGATKTQF